MITKLLVANRGEIAVRVMRSAHEAGISCVAVCSDPDRDAPHVSQADEVVRLPGAAPADTYLRADLLVEAAHLTGADAVHPGYGFLSENAGFARACSDAGLTFVGPPAEVIEAMGSKLTAKDTMAAAGVPVLPTLKIDFNDEGGPGSTPDLVERAGRIGFPVLVKASAGGGGRGMRIVEDAASLAAAVESAGREALSAFGDATLFIEPYARRPRHIEVQVMADTHGNVIHLFERECSIQRRHQKIIEESPSSAVDDATRAKLCDAAVTAARAIGYVNAGTVEFLMLQDGSIAFLEMNTRLQVEHPVTELVTGLDLVRLQLVVAEGGELPTEARFPTMRGHAIECRLYAEDPTAEWRPSTGRLHRFSIPDTPAIRVDAGVRDGSVVSPWYDPMLAKVIAYAPTRSEAARALGAALASSQLHGITTNRDLLVRILRHPEFVAGEIDTDFLVRHDPAELGVPIASEEAGKRHAVAAALASQAKRRAKAKVLGGIPSGWRNNLSEPQMASFVRNNKVIEIAYRFDRKGTCVDVSVTNDSEAKGEANSSEAKGEANSSEAKGEANSREAKGEANGIEVLNAQPTEAVLSSGAVTRTYKVNQVGLHYYVDGPDGSSDLMLVERFKLPESQLDPGSLVATLPGTIVRVEVAVGDHVLAGDNLVAIEAMKMEHEVRASHPGVVVSVAVSPGDQVESGRLLVVVDEEAPPDS